MANVESVFSSGFKNSLLDLMIQSLFSSFYKSHREQLNHIASANARLKSSGVSGFRYKGKAYCGMIGTPPYKYASLDSSLEENMNNLLEERARVYEEELDVIKAFLVRALNLSKVPADLWELLPKQIHGLFEKHLTQHRDKWDTTVPAADLWEFNMVNKHITGLIINRMMVNLILK